MRSSRSLLPIVLALTAVSLRAQVESLNPLHAQPTQASPRSMLRSSLHEWYIYQNASQQLPVMDDFSVDRTRHLNAGAGDVGVNPIDTVYVLAVAGLSSPEMTFSSDTTWHYTIDTTDPDTVIITRVSNPSASVTISDISTYPSPASIIEAFPPYTIFDTVNNATPDTIAIVPDLFQDSLLVYQVDPDPRIYVMGVDQRPWILWEDDDVLVNGTYPVDPPTLGVASFEGLDRTGYPYNDQVATAYGIADHLTSVPIDMLAPPGDSIYLSFFYQPQGLSGDDQVQPEDSLVLEFFKPVQDEWVRRWSTPYTALAPFKQVLIPIKEQEFLQNGFQFRFLNYATLSGALDHWHLDYVRLAKNRTYNDTALVDVCYLYPESSLLSDFTSVPYRKFKDSPASYMAAFVTDSIKNLSTDALIAYGFRAGVDGSPISSYSNFPSSVVNPSGNEYSTFGVQHPVNSTPNNFVYAAPAQDSCRFWRVQMYTNATPDINRYNDTTTFVQELSNYYAYDDGSAEAGYSLNVSGGKLAYRFDAQGTDTLRAVRIYFDPIFSENDPTDGSFLLTVWSSLNPETIVHQNFSFSSPEYVRWGTNRFVEYPLDSLVIVQGTFYVGWTQTNNIKMNIGFDKNRNNQGKIFYKVGSSFLNTAYQGSLMMRPVMVASKDPFADVPEIDAGGTSSLHVHPNPAASEFRVSLPDANGVAGLVALDATGRTVRQWPFAQGATYDVEGLAGGLYVVWAWSQDGRRVAQGRLLVPP